MQCALRQQFRTEGIPLAVIAEPGPTHRNATASASEAKHSLFIPMEAPWGAERRTKQAYRMQG